VGATNAGSSIGCSTSESVSLGITSSLSDSWSSVNAESGSSDNASLDKRICLILLVSALEIGSKD